MHADAFTAALAHGRQTGVLRVTDLGAGPSTASLALLLQLLDRPIEDIPPKVVLTWFDLNEKIMQEGRELAMMIDRQFPKLRGRIEIECIAEPWWKAHAELARRGAGAQSLLLLGHVLNESQGRTEDRMRIWQELLGIAEGGGTLIVDPASRGNSQKLSQLRDSLIEADLLREGMLWGPCLHAGRCPLAQGRDWCHFSMPVSIPGKWFREISKKLSTEKSWVKFSYLWIARTGSQIAAPAGLRRVVSDRIKSTKGPETEILLCEPEQVKRVEVSYAREIFRGELFDPANPMAGVKIKAAKKVLPTKHRAPARKGRK
jgi:ribosomal protein RSM22 (predicted rRNA methylase)